MLEEFIEKGMDVLWKWIMVQIDLNLSIEHLTFIEWALQNESVTDSEGFICEQVIRTIMDEVYNGTAREFLNQFWNSDGKGIDVAGSNLESAIQEMIAMLQLYIDEVQINKGDITMLADGSKRKTVILIENRSQMSLKKGIIKARVKPMRNRKRRESLTF